MNSLEVRNVSVAYDGLTALNAVNLTVPPKGMVCVLGANGAGKSSLLKAVCGIVPVSGGSISFGAKDITRMPVYQAAVTGISLSPEGRRLFPALSVEDNLKVGALRTPRIDAEKCLHQVFALFPRLRERMKQQAGSLSGGEQQMCAIGRALMANPKLLLLDEPSLGLAPKVIVEVGEAIREINRLGTSILLVEQNAGLALKIADYAYVFEAGQVVLEGDSAALRSDPHVQSIYLGG